MSRALTTILFLLTAYLPLRATTIVPPTDAQLVDKSDVVVIGTVESVEMVEIDGAIWTDASLSVERSLKGEAASTIRVREPGGQLHGRRTVVFGSPEFRDGERMLLFLSEVGDHPARVVDMIAGQFLDGGRGIWVRRSAVDVRLEGDASGFRQAREAEDFAEWIVSRAAGSEDECDCLLAPHALRIEPDFMLIAEPTVYRWKAFDRGVTIGWRSAGTQGGYRDGGRDAVRTGMASWTGYAAASVRYRFDGPSSSAPGGLVRRNGINEIIFEDPLGEIPGTWSSSAGGVVGVGGFNAVVNGGSWTPPFAADSLHNSAPIASTWEIVEANLVVQDGVAGSRGISEFEFSELIAHELGHTLGLGHSGDALALMFYQMTGLGPSLRGDDQLGVRWLYPAGESPPPQSRPVPPTDLTARAEGASSVHLDWVDASSNESGFVIYLAVDGSGFGRAAETEANRTTFTVDSLVAGARYRFVVTATNAAGESLPSNVVEITIESTLPRAAFQVTPVSGVAGITDFRFTDKSSGPVTEREWDFGDGTHSTLVSPVHRYEDSGQYQVKLTARSGSGQTSSATRSINVSSPAEPPRAAFSYSPTSVSTIDEIVFLDESTGHVQTWNWQFGDDTSSSIQNPLKRFDNPGTYTVTLHVTGQGHESSASRKIVVSGGSGSEQTVDAAFDIQAGVLVAGEPVQFRDLSIGSPNSWYWQFGDGLFSTSRHPIHAYGRAGTYTMLLRAGNEASSSSVSRTVHVYARETVARLLVPVVADIPGASESSWRSDLALFNDSPVEREVFVSLLPASGERAMTRITLGPQETKVWGNVMRDLFERPSSSGAMLLEAAGDGSPPRLVVSSRTFTRSGAATYGQGVAAIPVAGRSLLLTGIKSNGNFRTNVGIVNTAPTERRVTLTLRNGSGATVASAVHNAPAGSLSQRALASWFTAGQLDDAVTMLFDSSAEGVFGYASVVDNTTQDPVFIAAMVPLEPDESQFIPVAAAASGAAGTRWLTDITIADSKAQSRDLELTLLPMAPSVRGSFIVPIGDGGTAILSDAIRAIAGGDGAGAVVLGPGVVATSRTYTLDSSGGTWGQSVPPVRLRSGGETSSALTGLRHDTQFRTNLGFVNTGASTAHLVVALFGRDGTPLGTTELTVAPGALMQKAVGGLFPELEYGGVFSARITSSSPVTAYASIIDNVSGDPSFFLAR